MTVADLARLKQQFIERYGGTEEGLRVYHAPGRVNLIGEHTDYNGGYVFPAALTFGTTLLSRPPDGPHDRAGVDELSRGRADLPGRHRLRSGRRLDELPEGRSCANCSSAASTVAAATTAVPWRNSERCRSVVLGVDRGRDGLRVAGRWKGSRRTRWRSRCWSQQAENEFVGVKCGIMDQFAVANGKKDHAILLDVRHAGIRAGAVRQRRATSWSSATRTSAAELVDSKYNERRAQCEQAVRDLRQRSRISNCSAG